MAQKKINGAVAFIIVIAILSACFLAIYFIMPTVTKKIGETKENVAEMIPITVMETVFEQKLVTSKDDENYNNYDAYIKRSAEIVNELDTKFSFYNPESQIYQLNKEAGMNWVNLDEEVYSLVEKGMDASEVYDGRFNIALGAVSRLWNIAEQNYLGHKVPPTAAEVTRLKPGTNANDVTLYDTKDRLRLRSQLAEFDLGAMVKGYAIEKVMNYYKESGVRSAWVSLGGSSIGVMGTKPSGGLYEIGIRDPRGEINTDLVGSFNITDAFINTSGDYEQYFEYDGVRYCHIIDPKTLSPVQNDMMSVTVVGDSGVDTEILSTALFVGGMEEITPLLSNSDYKIIAITKDKSIYVSESLKPNFTLKEDSGYILK